LRHRAFLLLSQKRPDSFSRAFTGASAGQTVLAAFLSGAALQLAYLAGGFCLHHIPSTRRVPAEQKVRRFRA